MKVPYEGGGRWVPKSVKDAGDGAQKGSFIDKRYNLPRLNQEDSKYEPSSVSTEIAIVILKLQQTTVQDFHR